MTDSTERLDLSGAAREPAPAPADGDLDATQPLAPAGPAPASAPDAPEPGPAPATAPDSPTAQWQAAQPPAAQVPPVSRRVRIGTLVWGLVIAVVGAGVLAQTFGATIDTELALIVILCTAGVALVVSSIVAAVRKR